MVRVWRISGGSVGELGGLAVVVRQLLEATSTRGTCGGTGYLIGGARVSGVSPSQTQRWSVH